MESVYVGIDVQISKECPLAVISEEGRLIKSDWLTHDARNFSEYIGNLAEEFTVYVGIDAPRAPLEKAREWYWDGAWHPRLNQKGHGRHCEVVIKSLKLANPQWTRVHAECEPWMQFGFDLYVHLVSECDVYEVFPSASYTQLINNTDIRLDIDFSTCATGPKDMLDALVAAATVREYVNGRGDKVGGGDGLGMIILPRLLTEEQSRSGVMEWPRR